jgi:hypothetical protein
MEVRNVPRVIRDWSVTQGDYQRFATLYSDRFVIGHNFRGNPHAENAGSYSLDDLVNGRCDDLVMEYFGSDVREEMRFLARVELAWSAYPRECRCQIFGEGSRTDPAVPARLGLADPIDDPNAGGGMSCACRCRECGREWRIAVDASYHWTLFEWCELQGGARS